MRAHAAGIPAFFTPTGSSTAVEQGAIPVRYNDGGAENGILEPGHAKEVREFNGKRYVMEPALAGDVAFVRAWKADEAGNTIFRSVSPTPKLFFAQIDLRSDVDFRYTQNNYNGVAGRNAALTIVEVCFQ